jgi:transcriptional regulator with XRE-family HTH domain
MATNRTAIREGDRQARRQATRLGDELAALRLRAGLTQAVVSRALGIDRSVVSRLERGDPQVGLPIRFRVAALLGANLRLGAYAQSGPPIRDTAQARIVELILAGIDQRWRQTVEASLPGQDRRSVDLRLDGPAGTVLCELEEIIRELHSKRDAFRAAIGASNGRPIYLVLVLPKTRHHLEIVRHHPATIQAVFPMPSVAVASALADSNRPWTGDGILWTPISGRPPASRPPPTP